VFALSVIVIYELAKGPEPTPVKSDELAVNPLRDLPASWTNLS
jgi:hypothetical protein